MSVLVFFKKCRLLSREIASTVLGLMPEMVHRSTEGIAAAKARGSKLGRPPKQLPENFHEVYQKWKSGKLSVAEAAKECNMPSFTFYYKAKVYKNSTYI